MKLQNKKIALVHDFLLYPGGAEKVLQTMAQLFPTAPIFTLIKNEKLAKEMFPNRKVYTTFLQKAPLFLKKEKRHRYLLPFMPTAAETINLRDFDVAISSSSAFVKGLVVKPKTTHFSYIHAPMRYVWDWNREYIEEARLKGGIRFSTRLFLNYLRTWDRASADRPDFLIANSRYTSLRIKKYYRRQSQVIYPPVEVEKFTPTKEHQDYFLSVGRLVPYKQQKLLVNAFAKLNLPLTIVGEGPQKEELKEEAGGNPNIKILGYVKEEELVELYQNCRAFVCAAEDDFNITCIEAMAAGKPVIALNQGGTAETVIPGVTGELFEAAQLELIADGVRRFIENEEKNVYNIDTIRAHAENFSTEKFKENIKRIINEKLNE